MRALHHFEGFRASRETLASLTLEAKHLEHAETGQTDDDQVDRDNEIQNRGMIRIRMPAIRATIGGNVRGGDGH